MTLIPVLYEHSELPAEMRRAEEGYEHKFHVHFATFAYFPQNLLEQLHKPERDPTNLPLGVVIASQHDPSVLHEIGTLEQVANSPNLTIEDRHRYFAALKGAYQKLHRGPDEFVHQPDTLCIGIAREGRILAESMGWLPDGRSLRPDMKRIPFQGGLIVGLSQLPELRAFRRVVIIDGAIASGATSITLIEKLRAFSDNFSIYSVHSPYEGLRAITRYGCAAGVNVTVSVAHATLGLSKKYYAISSHDASKLVVGDLGDTISDLEV